MPVPYGFRVGHSLAVDGLVGDVLAVGAFVWKVYNAYVDAPAQQFHDFSKEILALHVVVKNVEQQLCTLAEAGGASSLTSKDREDLEALCDGLEIIVTELDALLIKYQSLTSNPQISFDRLKRGKEDLARLRKRIHTTISLLTAFNANLANRQLAKQNVQLIQQNTHLVGIQEQLGRLLAPGGLRHRESVASLQSIASFAQNIGQREEWKELCRELHRNGVTPELVSAKMEEIFNLCRTASTLRSRDRSDTEIHGADAENQGNRITKRESLPATRARQLVDGPGVHVSFGTATRRQPRQLVSTPPGPADLEEELLALGTTIEMLIKDSSALCRIAGRGCTEIVKVLLDNGTNINATVDGNWTALHRAAINGHTDVVKVLLDRRASIDAMTDSNSTALHLAAQYGHIAVVKMLLGKGAKVDILSNNRNSTALHLAATNGHTDVVEVLLDGGASIITHDNSTALHWAAANGHTAVVEMLLDRGVAIDALGYKSWTALQVAAEIGHIEVVKILLNKGASVDAVENQKWTALHCAAADGHIRVVKVLLDWRANIDAMTDSNSTALHLAARNGHIAVLKVLLDRGARIDSTTEGNWTALHLAAQNGHIGIVKVLLDRRASMDIRDKWGETVLHCAVRYGHIPIVELLLESGADINMH